MFIQVDIHRGEGVPVKIHVNKNLWQLNRYHSRGGEGVPPNLPVSLDVRVSYKLMWILVSEPKKDVDWFLL